MFSYKVSFLTQIGPNKANNWYIPSQKGRIKTRDLRNCAYLKMGVCVTAWCSIALHVCVRVRVDASLTYSHTFRHREEHSLTQTRTRRNETRKQNKERQKKTHSAERGPTLQNNHKCTRKKEVFVLVLKKQNKKKSVKLNRKERVLFVVVFFSRLHFMVALALLLQMMRFFRGFASLFSLCPGMPSFSEQLFCLKTKVR